MSVTYDDINRVLLYYVKCHGREKTFSLTQEAILKAPLLQTIGEKLKAAWGETIPAHLESWTTISSVSPIPFQTIKVSEAGITNRTPPHGQTIVTRLKAAADRTLLERPKRKIKFED